MTHTVQLKNNFRIIFLNNTIYMVLNKTISLRTQEDK